MAKTMKKGQNQNKATTSGIESRIQAIADVSTKLNILLYGRSGTGKTTILGSAPKPLLILDVREKGTVSIRKREDVFVLEITSWKDLEEVYWYLASGKSPYKSVAIDTVTQLQDYALAEIRGNSEGLVSRKSWGEASALLKTWIMLFRDLPMNIVFTAQDRKTKGTEEDDEEEDTSIMPEIGPYVMPSVAKILNAAVDVIGMTFIRETVKNVKNPVKGKPPTEKKVIEYCLRVGPHPVCLTKFRSPVAEGQNITNIPSVLVSPTFDEILELSLDEDEEE